MLAQLNQRLDGLLWHPRVAGLGTVPRAVIRGLRFLYAVLRDALTGNLTLHAMGLVYVTILSLVPLLAVSFSVLKAFGFQRRLQPLLYDLFEPLGERGVQLTNRIIGFVDNVHGDVLAGLGLLVLFFTAVSMAEKVEGSFNYVWRVERPRSLARRVSEYLSVILVGPVVMVTTMALIGKLSTAQFFKPVAGMTAFQTGGLAEQLAPYVLVCFAFTFVYWFVPNTRVRFGAALIGGVCGGVLWAATGALFANFVVKSTSTISIYASFAIAITALIWLYACWLILLVGAQLSFYVQNEDYLRFGYRQLVTGTGQQEEMALGLMFLIGRNFHQGAAAMRIAEVAQMTGLPGLALSPIASRLEAAGLLARTTDDRLVPGRDPHLIQLRQIIGAVRDPHGEDVHPGARWPQELHALSQRLESALEASLGNTTLKELVEKTG